MASLLAQDELVTHNVIGTKASALEREVFLLRKGPQNLF